MDYPEKWKGVVSNMLGRHRLWVLASRSFPLIFRPLPRAAHTTSNYQPTPASYIRSFAMQLAVLLDFRTTDI
jgi:hypothetical protein